MKHEPTANDVLSSQAKFIIDAYQASKEKEAGIIQFCLNYEQKEIKCYFLADGKTLQFEFGEPGHYDLRLTAGLYDWLDLAAGRLNPIWGIISKRLKFEGNPKVMNKIIKQDLLYKTAVSFDDPTDDFEQNPQKNWVPPRKVLILHGSPRGREGYTFHYLNRFIRGLNKAGANTKLIEIGKKNIKPCIGCFHCWKNDSGRCFQRDDMDELLEDYKQADLVVFSFTLYFDTVPSILKNFIERCFCLEQPYMIPGTIKTRHPRRIHDNKSMFVFSVCGFPEYSHFNSIKQYFKSISHGMHIPLIGGIYRSACMSIVQDSLYFEKYNNIMNAIEQAGSSIYKTGKMDRKLKKIIETKVDAKAFRKTANKFWENVVIKKDAFCIKHV